MSYTVSCGAEPLHIPGKECGGWKCQYYNCSVNEEPMRPRCMCFCRYGLVFSCVTFLIYFVLFIVAWRRQMTAARASVGFGLAIAGGLVSLSIFTEKCDAVMISSVVEVALLTCCLACICPAVTTERGGDGDAPLLGSNSNQANHPMMLNRVVPEDDPSCPAIAIGPDGEEVLAVPELGYSTK